MFFTEHGVDPQKFYGRGDAEPQEEVRPMNEAEYKRLRADVEVEKKTAQAPPGADPKHRYGGQLPALRNHSMQLYLERVEKFVKPGTGQVIP